jgi:hypothetical protein
MRSFLESEIDMKRDEEQIKSWRRVSDPGPCQARVRRERPNYARFGGHFTQMYSFSHQRNSNDLRMGPH